MNNWRTFCDDNMTLAELRKAIDDNFNLDVAMETVVFVARVNNKLYYLPGKTKITDSKVKSLAEYEIKVQRKKGEPNKKVRLIY